ncbi:response regulator transcription factor [Holospora curviuscula]|uniref:Transcriptional regulatory protein OmpR n=1 Tax=Holospora curviuscula TaxID=1082868 RepID=A0A2S5RAV2_9PROT|nr:response regulator transcription factor [Holospora curviuscula]PPE04255.1 Transcriptional regulatory protein OmpR [Holospora curviuscula]
MMAPHILLVDDDLRLLDLIKRYLHQYHYWVSSATRVIHAEQALSTFRFDAIILDVMLPEEDGWSFLERRSFDLPPVIFLSAMGGPKERVKGLSLGAKDYIMKPFEPTELLLRLRNLIPAARILQLGNVWLNLQQKVLYDAQQHIIPLTELENKVLVYMAHRPNKVIKRDELVERFFSATSNPRVLDVTLSRLRKKLDPSNTHRGILHAIRNQGYILKLHT